MNGIQQKSLADVLRNPYEAGVEARRIADELSDIPSKSSSQLRTRLMIIFRYAALNLTPEQKHSYSAGYWKATKYAYR